MLELKASPALSIPPPKYLTPKSRDSQQKKRYQSSQNPHYHSHPTTYKSSHTTHVQESTNHRDHTFKQLKIYQFSFFRLHLITILKRFISHQTPNIQHPPSRIQHPTSNIQHPTPNTQHPPSSIQHPTSNTQHLLITFPFVIPNKY